MTRSGRPEVGPMLSLRFPRSLTERLDALASERDTTRSALIRLAAERFLEEDTMTTITHCSICDVDAETRTCHICGRTATVIDCGHYQQPAEIAADEQGRPVCGDCAT